MFVDKHEKTTNLPIVLDERLFSDTVLRVIQVKPNVYIVSDIRYLNGINVYEKLSYESRRCLLNTLIEEFHQTELTALLTDAPVDCILHGWEYYDNEPGSMGVFLPARE